MKDSSGGTVWEYQVPKDCSQSLLNLHLVSYLGRDGIFVNDVLGPPADSSVAPRVSHESSDGNSTRASNENSLSSLTADLLELSAEHKKFLVDSMVSNPTVQPLTLYMEARLQFMGDNFFAEDNGNAAIVIVRNFVKKWRELFRNQNVNAETYPEESSCGLVNYSNSHDIYVKANSFSFCKTNTYSSLEDFRKAFGNIGVEVPLTVPVTPELLLRCNCAEDHMAKAMQSVLFFGIGNLYTLYTFLFKVPHRSQRMISVDGTYNITDRYNSSLISYGAICVDSGPDIPSVIRRKFRPICHFLTSNETTVGSFLVCTIIKDLCLKIFDRELGVDNFISDNSAALRAGIKQAFPDATLHLCYPHILRMFDAGEWKKKIHEDNHSRIKRDVAMLGQCCKYISFYNMFALCEKSWRSLHNKKWCEIGGPVEGVEPRSAPNQMC